MNKKLTLLVTTAVFLAAVSTIRLEASGCSGEGCGNNNDYRYGEMEHFHGSVLNGTNPAGGYVWVATVPAKAYHPTCCTMYVSYSGEDIENHGHN